MGMWGYEIFESDAALDSLGRIMEFIHDNIHSELRMIESEGILEHSVMAQATCLLAIARHIPEAKNYLAQHDVAAWQHDVLVWIDRYRGELEDSGYDTVKILHQATKIFGELEAIAAE